MLNKSSNIIEKEFKNLRKELLDLTLRNPLLNFKTRAKTITIVNQSPINIFQTLVLQDNKMYFVANKKDKKEDKSSVWDHIPFDFSKFAEGDEKTGEAYTTIRNNIGVVSMGVGAITTLKCEEFSGMSSAATPCWAVRLIFSWRKKGISWKA